MLPQFYCQHVNKYRRDPLGTSVMEVHTGCRVYLTLKITVITMCKPDLTLELTICALS